MEDFTIQQLRDAMDNLLHNAELAEDDGDLELGELFREKHDLCHLIYVGKFRGEGPYAYLYKAAA